MKVNTNKGISRRQFLSYSALGLAGLTILPSWAINGVKMAPSDRVVLGFVGLGQQGCSDFKSFSTCPGVQVAACCDVDSIKRERFRRRVADWQKSAGMNERCDMGTAFTQTVVCLGSLSSFRTFGRSNDGIAPIVCTESRCAFDRCIQYAELEL